MDDTAIYYGDTAPFLTGTENILSYCENLTIAAKSQERCGLNSIVFITNRLIEIDETGNLNLPLVFKEIFNVSCSQLTIVVVGNNEITMGLLKYEYGNITNNLFLVDDYTCLGELVDCMPPCDHTKYSTCAQYQTFHCSIQPIDEYFNQVGNNISIAFFSIYNETYWLDTKTELDLAFSRLTYNNVITNSEVVDVKDRITTNLVVEAISVYGKHEVPDDVLALPRIVLLSDFASENFAHAYQSQLFQDLSNFLFNMILFDQQAESYYYANSTIPKASIRFSNLSNLVPEPIYWPHHTTPKPETVKAISHLAEIFLIIGLIFAIALIVLIVAIVVRQRAILLKKVAFFSFKNNSNDDLHL
uniref:Uncharacterized protein n=1 Tax=Acrobeloides nanus TaxID=290746 RepID=A0A914D2V3_9BILA